MKNDNRRVETIISPIEPCVFLMGKREALLLSW